MQVKVERISKGKTQKGTDKTGLFDGKNWYNVMGTHEVTGQTVELEKTNFGKDWYEIKSAAPAQPESNGSSNGNGIAWADYALMAKAAHQLALELEPDGSNTRTTEGAADEFVTVDRSAARAAILNTVMIAFSNGKIMALEDDLPF